MNLPTKIGQPRFLTKDKVLTLHRASLDAYGGADGFLNEGALDSAIAQPRQEFGGEFNHEFPFGMAAAYGFHIAMNHAFRDGTKRIAFACMVAFLRMSGWNLASEDASAADLILELIEQHRDKHWLAAKLAQTARARPSLEVRDFFSMPGPSVHFEQIDALGGSTREEIARQAPGSRRINVGCPSSGRTDGGSHTHRRSRSGPHLRGENPLFDVPLPHRRRHGLRVVMWIRSPNRAG